MSDTPRTDEIANFGYQEVKYICEMTNHARTLERELGKAKAARADEQRELQKFRYGCDQAIQERESLREQLTAVTAERDRLREALGQVLNCCAELKGKFLPTSWESNVADTFERAALAKESQHKTK